MFEFYFLHAVYAIFMAIFSFRLMVIPHAIGVAMLAIYWIATKGVILAPIIMFLYSFVAIMLAIGMNDTDGNECIIWWVIAASNLSYVCYTWLL